MNENQNQNQTVTEQIAAAKQDWQHHHGDHLSDTGHLAGVDRTFEGGDVIGIRIGCVDEDGNAELCGTWEEFSFRAA